MAATEGKSAAAAVALAFKFLTAASVPSPEDRCYNIFVCIQLNAHRRNQTVNMAKDDRLIYELPLLCYVFRLLVTYNTHLALSLPNFSYRIIRS